jgi:group I intron endonuclease
MADDTVPQSGIYEILNTTNGKRYVGSAKNFGTRWKAHRTDLNRGKHHSRYLQAAWNKYGAEAFAFNVLECCSLELLIEREQALIDAIAPEYNMAKRAGNTLGTKRTAESRLKISAALKGKRLGRARSPESVAATAAAHRGMKRSEETRAKISERAKGRKRGPRSDQHCANLSAAMKGKPKSQAHIDALQAGRRAHVITDEQRRNISESLRAAYESGVRKREKSETHKNRISEAFSKLSADQVREIRALRAQGVPLGALSAQFGTPKSTVSQIARGLRYRWVTD